MAMFEGLRWFKDSEDDFLYTSTTIDGLSYCPSSSEEVRNAAQMDATGRRSWKTLRGKGEAVWSPRLEAALLEALEKYKITAACAKGTKGQHRAPMRNRFIADYIFETTGKRRTSKQVGSRLQQLRSTCKEESILELLVPGNTTTADTSSPEFSLESRSPSPDSDCMGLSSSPHNAQFGPACSVHVHISLDKLSSDNSWKRRGSAPRVFPMYPDMTTAVLPFAPMQVHITSPICLSDHSEFFVYSNRVQIHTEVVQLEFISSTNRGSGWIYKSTLVPDFWHGLRVSTDPSIYTIVQTFSSLYNSRSSAGHTRHQSPLSIIYDFEMPRCPQDHVHHDVYHVRSRFDDINTSLQPDPAHLLMPSDTLGEATHLTQTEGPNSWSAHVETFDPINMPLESFYKGIGETMLGASGVFYLS